jgi:hypothetical protein
VCIHRWLVMACCWTPWYPRTMSWKEDVRHLAEQVEDWVSHDLSSKDAFVLHEMTMDPTPDEPLLEMEVVNGPAILRLEPAAFAVDQTPTKVHLYAYPTLRRVILFGPLANNAWEVQTSEGVPMNYPWTSAGLIDLLRVLSENPRAAKSV